MKYLKICMLLSIVSLFMACDKEDKDFNTCIELESNASYVVENFKTDYSIAFPSNYEGNGMVGFEGNFFSKNRTDSLVEFSYAFCGALFCVDFGGELVSPAPASVHVTDIIANIDLTLDERLEFCEGGVVTMYLYYNEAAERQAKLFMLGGGIYYEALTITYNQSAQAEIESIVKTIQ